jgi:hypothetical protein
MTGQWGKFKGSDWDANHAPSRFTCAIVSESPAAGFASETTRSCSSSGQNSNNNTVERAYNK